MVSGIVFGKSLLITSGNLKGLKIPINNNELGIFNICDKVQCNVHVSPFTCEIECSGLKLKKYKSKLNIIHEEMDEDI